MTSTQSHASSSEVHSHHLIGRALVPFFDAEENVNASMTVDPMTQLYEQVDIDARVWDKTLGYFVYPSEQTATTSVSTPITIQKPASNVQKSPLWNENGGNSMLLTPDFLLSRSAPNTSTSSSSSFKTRPLSTQTSTVQVPPSTTSPTEKSTTRSSSAQRSSTRSKSRSNTPNRNRVEKNKSTSSSPPSTSTVENTTTNNGKKKRASKEKVKEELSTSGKWAWSAFQNSPDPKSLPLPPPFTTNSPLLNSSTDHGKMTIPLELPPPCVPPDSIVKTREKEEEASIEHSMTQDLRRMLNIGGG